MMILYDTSLQIEISKLKPCWFETKHANDLGPVDGEKTVCLLET